MLHSVKIVKGNSLSAKDGDIGKVKDLYFDDASWTLRYFVVETLRDWLESRKVLISPSFVERGFKYTDMMIPISLTREQVKNSPSYDSQKPVSRQYEEAYSRYYDLPYYWVYPGIWGYGIFPNDLSWARDHVKDETDFVIEKQNQDPHLRSCNEVKGYRIDTLDGRMGNIEDFIFDDESWTIRYLVIDTVNWWPSKKVLISPTWASEVDWVERSLHIDLTKQEIKNSPEYEPDNILHRSYEESLYKHYGRPVYWDRIDEFKRSHRAA